MGLHVVILAAGFGSRMNSSIPKVIHLLAGTPLLEHVIRTAEALEPDKIHVIYGFGGDQIKQRLSHLNVHWVFQEKQLGTGHAVMQAMPHINPSDQVLVLYGDVPLISLATLKNLLDATPRNGIGVVSAEFNDPTGLGRIIRDNSGNMIGIVEEKDANEKEKQIKEIWGGIITTTAERLSEFLPKLDNKNAQQEYYLPVIINMAVRAKCSVIAILAKYAREVEGVNDRFQLADLERFYQSQAAERVMLAGASLKDPARFDVRGTLEVSSDVIIDVNVVIEGHVMLGKNTYVGPNSLLRNCRIGENVEIKANSFIDGAIIEDNCSVGPFCHIRPGTHLRAHSKIGNFVEIKKSDIGEHSKINHLSYIGDTTMGREVNIGAGTITCNYDGVNKYNTVIEDYVFIGSNSQLIAPVKIGIGATVGAGATITKDVPAYKLTINTIQQRVIEAWERPKKREK